MPSAAPPHAGPRVPLEHPHCCPRCRRRPLLRHPQHLQEVAHAPRVMQRKSERKLWRCVYSIRQETSYCQQDQIVQWLKQSQNLYSLWKARKGSNRLCRLRQMRRHFYRRQTDPDESFFVWRGYPWSGWWNLSGNLDQHRNGSSCSTTGCCGRRRWLRQRIIEAVEIEPVLRTVGWLRQGNCGVSASGGVVGRRWVEERMSEGVGEERTPLRRNDAIIDFYLKTQITWKPNNTKMLSKQLLIFVVQCYQYQVNGNTQTHERE